MADANIKKLEAMWKEAYARTAGRREADNRIAGKGKGNNGAYLTQDLLRKRQLLTRGGTQALALDYGIKNATKIEFTLDELNKMVQQVNKTKKVFHGKQKGVTVAELISASRKKDRENARAVAAATLYKFAGDVLYFSVTASGDTLGAPSHYQVKVQLNEWDANINKYEGKKYLIAAQKTTIGRVSFDCSCGRHQFYYRYLACIGGFALTPPKENIFPKIRNPKLTGACCKHTLKALLALQSPVVQGRIAKEMEAEAKRHGFGDPVEKELSTEDLKAMEKAGEFNTLGGFQKFTAAMKAFDKKKKTPKAKAAISKLVRDNEAKMKELSMQKKAAEMVAKKEIAARRAAELLAEKERNKGYVNGLKMLKQLNMLNDAGFKAMSENTGVDAETLQKIAKDEGLL